MIILRRTNSNDKDFRKLVKELGRELMIRDGDEHLFYAQLNKTYQIKHIIIAGEENGPVGCGVIRDIKKHYGN